jgi:hypothetical protein
MTQLNTDNGIFFLSVGFQLDSVLGLPSWFYTGIPNSPMILFWNIDPHYTSKSRDNAVGIATGYRLEDRGVGFRVPVE